LVEIRMGGKLLYSLAAAIMMFGSREPMSIVLIAVLPHEPVRGVQLLPLLVDRYGRLLAV
jgi:hypothetical protein